MTARRLDNGGRINRAQKVPFTWDGQELKGYVGDTLASALMANNQVVLGRSFKYHRPRGIMSAGVEESGAIVTVGSGDKTEPNVKATMQELFAGIEVKGQNAWPNVRMDVGAVNGLFSRFFSAGFYYKTFMGLPPFESFKRGTGLWMQYEKIIRKAAGMGTASREPDPDHYDQAHGFCDILVVGSGVAGLHAALTAAKAGKDVLLVEQDFALGGDYLNQPLEGAEAERTALIAEVEAAGVRIMTRTTAFGLYDYGVAGLVERVTDHLSGPNKFLPRQRFWTMRAGATILATGALERSVAFAGNDVPNVMTTTAARAYLNRYGILAGQRIVISTNNDSAYGTASELAAAGAEVSLVDARDSVNITAADNVAVTMGLAPLQALGRGAVHGVKFAKETASGWQTDISKDCDLLLVSGGFSPVVNLLSHRGAKPEWDAELACFIASSTTENIQMAGSAAGVWTAEGCKKSGIAAAKCAMGKKADQPALGGWSTPIKPLYEVRLPNSMPKAFVDPQHDVTSNDVRLAHQEGFVSVEHMKRYTTLGMATDQGKMGNIIGLALMAEALGKEIPAVGTTRFRPPYTPIAIGALSGRIVGNHSKALRRTPLHAWNLKNGATMTDAGLWQRPWFFAREGETITEAYIRETTTVRERVGLCDVSTLGKISVQGPDASEFLNRVYSNAFAKLAVGKARYGIMLRDDGVVMDDGTTWRMSENDFLMTTTTAQAGRVMVFLEELLQTRWTDLKVHLASVSDQWAGVAVAGPNSRDTIQACLADPDQVSNESLPFMGVRQITLKGGSVCWIARISFSGEMAFEVYAPSNEAEHMMDMLWQSAQTYDGCLYGTEALGALRIEKGHVTAAELDGRVTIDDAGLGKMASTKKSFIGSALRQRPELLKEGRPQLVGIFPKDRSETFKAGSILCHSDQVSGFGEGWITAVTYSPVFGHWIGLGYISGGYKAWEGKAVTASDPTRRGDFAVEIVSPHMYDPKGERMHG